MVVVMAIDRPARPAVNSAAGVAHATLVDIPDAAVASADIAPHQGFLVGLASDVLADRRALHNTGEEDYGVWLQLAQVGGAVDPITFSYV
ncbi:hypothetical protein D3C85_1457300 [compost metagenome]